MTDEQTYYFRVNNQMLFWAFEYGNIAGSYCLAFAAALYAESGVMPPVWIMQQFTDCASVQKGFELYTHYRKFEAERLRQEYLSLMPPDPPEARAPENAAL
jgi:hypothetical protein